MRYRASLPVLAASALLVLAAGCGADAPRPNQPRALAYISLRPVAPTPGVKGAPDREMVYHPNTIDELRAGMPVGREIFYEMELAGKPKTTEHWTVVAADEDSMTMATESYGEDGALIERTKTTTMWADLFQRAVFPVEKTEMRKGTIVTPMGELSGVVFEVSDVVDGDPTVKRFFFDRAVAGPPVYFSLDVNGQRSASTHMLKRK